MTKKTNNRRAQAADDAATTGARPTGAKPPIITHLTLGERAAIGRTARAKTPRESHAAWEPPTDRPDPIELLEEQAESRIADLVPIRYGRMLASPFAFYRGAAVIMASDLSTTPQSGIHAQLCGDAHLANFGGFASPERDLVFNINDFDETLPGPWEWDVKRLAASIEIAGRERAFSAKERQTVRAGGSGGVSARDGRVCHPEQPHGLARHAECGGYSPALGAGTAGRGAQALGAARGGGARQGQCPRARTPDPAGGWAAADCQQPAIGRPR